LVLRTFSTLIGAMRRRGVEFDVLLVGPLGFEPTTNGL